MYDPAKPPPRQFDARRLRLVLLGAATPPFQGGKNCHFHLWSKPRFGVNVARMNILLLSMPDSFEHMAEVVVRMPNGALTSLAGNIDPHHSVEVADLIVVQRRVPQTVEQLVKDFQPDLVGLSVMTFQRETARRIIALVHKLRPSARIAVGGYDPS